MTRIDPTKIIDREEETALFEQLVTLTLARRVMTVNGESGTGKTDLLRKFRLLAVRDHQVPVAHVALEDFRENPDEFEVVQRIHKNLVATGLRLPSYEALNAARAFKSSVRFTEEIKNIGSVDLTNATINDAPKIAGVMYNANSVYVTSEWDDEQEVQARAVCVRAFFTDLIACALQQPVVLLFDSLDVDIVAEELRDWIVSEFVRNQALTDWQNRKLIIVMAGCDVDEVLLGRLNATEQLGVEPLRPFAPWTAVQVRACLESHGVESLKDGEFDAVCSLLNAGHSLMSVISFATQWSKQRSGRR